jgi:ribosome biogenesis protein Nip4
MPLRDFSLGRLFQWLSISDVRTCFTAMLLEKRVLFVSQSVWKLTSAIETLSLLAGYKKSA